MLMEGNKNTRLALKMHYPLFPRGSLIEINTGRDITMRHRDVTVIVYIYIHIYFLYFAHYFF